MRQLFKIAIAGALLAVASVFVVVTFRETAAGTLRVDPEIIRVAMVIGDTHANGSVSVKNVGSSVAEILAIQPTCSCSVATPKTRTLKPNETTELTFTISGLSVGRHAKALRVDYKSRGVKSLVIPIEIRVNEPDPPWIAEAPTEIVLSCRPTMKQGSVKFLMRTKERSAEEPPFLTGLRSSDERIQTEVESIQEVQILPDGSVEREYRMVATADVASLVGGGFSAMMSPTVRGELALPVKDIPIQVRLASPFRVIPSILSFAINADAKTKLEQSALVLSEERHESWSVSSATPLPDWLEVRLNPHAANLLRVTCCLDPEALRQTTPDDDFVRKEILIDVDTMQDEIRIPFEIRFVADNR